jgi:hypothetical protein
MLHKNNIAKKSPKGLDNSAKIGYNGTMMIDKELKMSGLKEYTLEIYKADRRIKSGYRKIEVIDFAPSTKDYIDSVAAAHQANGYFVKIFETYVTKTNLMGGKEFTERYDTPHYCSPSSESYWSM